MPTKKPLANFLPASDAEAEAIKVFASALSVAVTELLRDSLRHYMLQVARQARTDAMTEPDDARKAFLLSLAELGEAATAFPARLPVPAGKGWPKHKPHPGAGRKRKAPS